MYNVMMNMEWDMIIKYGYVTIHEIALKYTYNKG